MASWISTSDYHGNVPCWAAQEATQKQTQYERWLDAVIPGLGLCRFARVGDSCAGDRICTCASLVAPYC